MMNTIPDHIKNAAFEAHMTAADKIVEALGIERATPGDVATTLAYAYGEALALYANYGAEDSQLAALGTVCINAELGMLSRIQASDCEGTA